MYENYKVTKSNIVRLYILCVFNRKLGFIPANTFA